MIDSWPRLLKNRTFIYGVVLVLAIVIGIAQTAIMYDSGLGMGDNSTFYAFARNLVHGEAMYKDFIHFRTPGTVGLYSLLMHIFGQQQSTIELSTRIEILILYPILFTVSAMIFFQKRNPYLVLAALAGIIFLPGYAQLRAGFGLLAIAVYSLTFSETNPKRRQRLLFATGLLAGVTFIFGQEIALMVGLCVAAGELYREKIQTVAFRRNVAAIVAGVALALAPLIVYLLFWSSISTFAYYVTYYSFIRQPEFMNIPFPSLSYGNLILYVPFVLYWLCFLALYFNKKLGIKEGLLLSFGILRLITALGRSDSGHFIFSIPEVFIIVPYMLGTIPSAIPTKRLARSVAPYAFALIIIFVVATKQSIILAAVPFLILGVLYKRNDSSKNRSDKNVNAIAWLHASLVASFVIFLYLMTPTYITNVRSIKTEALSNDAHALRIGGVKTDLDNYRQITEIRKATEPLHPNTVFSFPIQPFYYSLAYHHASRFLTFEPQTTVKEQDETISDLQRTKPPVVIFDPLQAQALSGSLWKISDYITTHYQIKKLIVHKEILWLMVPQTEAHKDDKLVFRLYKDNTTATASGVQSPAANLENAIQQDRTTITFQLAATHQAQYLRLHITKHAGYGDCGTVVITGHGKTTLCVSDGEKLLSLPTSTPTSITFTNPGPKSILWDDPSIVSK